MISEPATSLIAPEEKHSALNVPESMEHVHEKKEETVTISQDEEDHHVFGIVATN